MLTRCSSETRILSLARISLGIVLVTLLGTTTGCKALDAIRDMTKTAPLEDRLMTLTATPSALPEGGGEVLLTATVTVGGAADDGVRVQFDSSAGEFIPGESALTDADGIARVRLNTTQPATISASITVASVALVTSGEVSIAVGGTAEDTSAVVYDFASTPNPATVGESAELEISAARDGTAVSGSLGVDFGDGQQTTLGNFNGNATVNHVYDSTGSFQVAATLTEEGGATSNSTFDIVVTSVAATVVGITASAAQIDAREPLAFDVTVTDADGNDASGTVSVDWGDGRSTRIGEVSGTAEVDHTYREPGSYRALAALTGADGTISRASVRVRIVERYNVSARLSVSPSTPVVAGVTIFTLAVSRTDGKSANGAGAISFGDGVTETAPVIGGAARFSNEYTEAGEYVVDAGFDDGAGHTATARLVVTVVAAPAPDPTPSPDPSPDPNPGDGDEIDANSLVWLHPNAANWPITSTTTNVSVSKGQICISHTKAGKWPVLSGVEGNPWVVGNVNGTWYAGNYEWLRPGQTCKSLGVPNENPDTAHALGPHIKISPLNTWVPKSGETVYFFVTTLNRAGLSTSDERSNMVKVIWP